MPKTTSPNERCNILIVEDDRDDVVLLDRALRAAAKTNGVEVEIMHVANGFEALSAVARGDLTSRLPHVVIVDLNMPIMGGELFLRRLRGDLGLTGLPAVVLTTSSDRPIHAAAMTSGANCVFVKPNSFAELLAIANKVIDFATVGELTVH